MKLEVTLPAYTNYFHLCTLFSPLLTLDLFRVTAGISLLFQNNLLACSRKNIKRLSFVLFEVGSHVGVGFCIHLQGKRVLLVPSFWIANLRLVKDLV